MIRNIIFDIGRVLIRFEWQEYLAGFGLSPEAEKAIGDAVFTSSTWNEFDRGTLSDEEILARFCTAAPDYQAEIRKIFAEFPAHLTELPHTMPWLLGLKEQGYALYYLSNFPRTVHQTCCQALRFIDLCEGGIMSYQVCHTKPEPEIYQALFNQYNLDPSTCVFIDDRQENLDAGAAFGLHTLLFTEYEETAEKLSALLAGEVQ